MPKPDAAVDLAREWLSALFGTLKEKDLPEMSKPNPALELANNIKKFGLRWDIRALDPPRRHARAPKRIARLVLNDQALLQGVKAAVAEYKDGGCLCIWRDASGSRLVVHRNTFANFDAALSDTMKKTVRVCVGRMHQVGSALAE